MNVIVAITAIIAVVLSVINLRIIRIHSSPKPFLKVEYVHVGSHIPVSYISAKDLRTGNYKIDGSQADTEQDLSPTIGLTNWGKGIAVNIKVYANANEKSGEPITVYLEGPSVVPDASIIKEKEYIAIYNSVRKDVLFPEFLTITINYESDTGYKRETIWVHEQTDEGSMIRLIKSK